MKVTELIEYLKSIPVDAELVVKLSRGKYDYQYIIDRIEGYYFNEKWHFRQSVVLVLGSVKSVDQC